MCCGLKDMENEKEYFTGAVNVKQACVWMGASRTITQISTCNLVARHAYTGYLVNKVSYKIIISSALCKKIIQLSHVQD
jgi:hypothetical protein